MVTKIARIPKIIKTTDVDTEIRDITTITRITKITKITGIMEGSAVCCSSWLITLRQLINEMHTRSQTTSVAYKECTSKVSGERH